METITKKVESVVGYVLADEGDYLLVAQKPTDKDECYALIFTDSEGEQFGEAYINIEDVSFAEALLKSVKELVKLVRRHENAG